MINRIFNLVNHFGHKKMKPTKGLGKRYPKLTKAFDPHSLDVMKELVAAGYEAYLVGGCVRDGLLGVRSKDCDVVTDARPDRIHRLFRRSLLIGKRFKIVHVRFKRHFVEVITFRGPYHSEQDENVYGTLKEDVLRRDFTINALYWHYPSTRIIDLVGGLTDLKKGIIRCIGKPDKRFQEDPVRMLRALRFCAKLQFKIGHDELKALKRYRHLLTSVSSQRLSQEITKLLHTGHAEQSMQLVLAWKWQDLLFPCADMKSFNELDQELLMSGLRQTDLRYKHKKPLNPGFIFALIYWPVWCQFMKTQKVCRTMLDVRRAFEGFYREVLNRVQLPRRTLDTMLDIYALQVFFLKKNIRNKASMLGMKLFRAGFDFLKLRSDQGLIAQEYVYYWQKQLES